MGKTSDLTGQKFGRLKVIGRAPNRIDASGKNRIYWECECECGTIAEVASDSLRSGRQQSCGCYKREYLHKAKSSHQETKSRLYGIWLAMKRRCDTDTLPCYKDYGGRGIQVCDEWVSDYTSFRNWAIQNGYNDGLSIDRIDNDGNYTPDNCRWVDSVAQANNRRSNHLLTLNGETHNITEWAKILGKNPKTLFSRVYSGWSDEKALTT